MCGGGRQENMTGIVASGVTGPVYQEKRDPGDGKTRPVQPVSGSTSGRYFRRVFSHVKEGPWPGHDLLCRYNRSPVQPVAAISGAYCKELID